MNPDKSLQGHKLLILTPWRPTEDFFDRLRSEHPGLEVVYHALDWQAKKPGSDFPEKEWEDVTILLTGSALPSREAAPKLAYVQLMSAGANHILENPLFLKTDVAFCTANGVHG